MDERFADKTFDLRKWIPGFCIDDSNRAALCFREALIIALKGDIANGVEPVGGYCIQVEPIGPQGREFLVHVHSSMTVDGYFSGTKLISSITEKLQCLEEKYTEFLDKKGSLYEKSLFVGLEENAYHVEIARTCPCDMSPLSDAKDLNLCQFEHFISEGTNVLLMRYLAITNYQGVLRFQNITIDGVIAVSDYTCTALQDMELHGRDQNVYTIERRIHKEGSLVQCIKTYLTSRGRILLHEWSDIPYVVQINPLLLHEEINEIIDVQIPLRERWMQDIEMFSKYLDTKSCNIVQYTDYLVDHPEIKQLIADYVQTLLIVKPIDVIDFTIQHFKAFAREPKAWDTHSFMKQSDVDINLQLSRDKEEDTCNFCGICIKCRLLSQFDELLPEQHKSNV